MTQEMVGKMHREAAESHVLEFVRDAIINVTDQVDLTYAQAAFAHAITQGIIMYLSYGQSNYGDAWYEEKHPEIPAAFGCKKFAERLYRVFLTRDVVEPSPEKVRSNADDLIVYAVFLRAALDRGYTTWVTANKTSPEESDASDSMATTVVAVKPPDPKKGAKRARGRTSARKSTGER